ncbi:enoyl-CoA hydratase/isomerase family protein [Echinimonas agarilytica]|uniref:3-hydroxyisobutyryl-CoA hydrolase n=1 Tax=Echinimonas agarilytica TaxID=1215918 RepID=A0AA41W6C0_9GAMM|nr:enoyl-CoA hydratase/isomerase family protein [Echinimonas agarilytica]MCM2679566.1 enoyl-CoA hydratase/isomerase family protein [Echinimonas agarilytica]
MTQSVLCSELPTSNGLVIGLLTLNQADNLNALNLEKVKVMLDQLTRWEADESVVAVCIQSSCERAFCAGGDIISMHQLITQNPNQIQPDLVDFFAAEYRLDHFIHGYSKPIVVWADSIVMGGGVGLLVGASHRVVTERSRLAMPEIAIGLFPDVGSTWFLNRVGRQIARFLMLTGSQMNGADAVSLDLADVQIPNTERPNVMARLASAAWADATNHHELVSDVLKESSLDTSGRGWIEPRYNAIHALCLGDSLEDVAAQFAAYDGNDGWIKKAVSNFQYGSPITAHIIWRQLQYGGMPLADCFRLELCIAAHCGSMGDLSEGIRALLIDKDRQPNWRFKSVSEVPASLIDEMLACPWPAPLHPLADLDTLHQSLALVGTGE